MFFARDVLATAFLFISTFAFTAASTMPLTDPPGKKPGIVKTDPGTLVPIASAEELGSFIRQNSLAVSVSNETGTIRYESPSYFLDGNDLATSVSAVYSLSTGNVVSLFIISKNRSGQQAFNLFPYDQQKNETTEGPATAEWILMELNRINALSQPNKFIQSSTPSSQSSQSQPAQTARSGSLQETQKNNKQ